MAPKGWVALVTGALPVFNLRTGDLREKNKQTLKKAGHLRDPFETMAQLNDKNVREFSETR